MTYVPNMIHICPNIYKYIYIYIYIYLKNKIATLIMT